MSDAQVKEALDVANRAMLKLQTLEATSKEIVNTTIQLAEFTKSKLDAAIIEVAAGNAPRAVLILGDLRIRFDRFLQQSEKFA